MIKWAMRFAKRLFGKYETGYEYWVKLSDIHITPQFRWRELNQLNIKENGGSTIGMDIAKAELF